MNNDKLDLDILPKNGAIPLSGEPHIKTGLRDRRLAEAAKERSEELARKVAKAKRESLRQERRRIARKKELKDLALTVLGTLALAAAAWALFNMADIIDKDIIRERGGDPNIGFHGEYVGDPNNAPEDFYVPNKPGSRGR